MRNPITWLSARPPKRAVVIASRSRTPHTMDLTRRRCPCCSLDTRRVLIASCTFRENESVMLAMPSSFLRECLRHPRSHHSPRGPVHSHSSFQRPGVFDGRGWIESNALLRPEQSLRGLPSGQNLPPPCAMSTFTPRENRIIDGLRSSLAVSRATPTAAVGLSWKLGRPVR
jgi:hypothetical protein